MHTDPVWAAEEGPFGGLIASGIQVMGVWMRLAVPVLWEPSAVVAGKALEHIKLRKPLRPDMPVDGAAEVLRVDLRDDGRGVVRFLGTLHDTAGELVFEHVNETVFLRRPG
jgi:acyl dehydratase